jgi:formylglycine-generating enzyme required for sulfatase activity
MNVAATGLGCNIIRSGGAGNYSYAVAQDWANRPVNYVSWGDAARFCNWLQKGQPTGVQGPDTTETGTYALNGANTDAALAAVLRDAKAQYVIPNFDEWYKAAFYDPNKNGLGAPGYWKFPTKSDSVPINVLDPLGTNNANFFDRLGTGTTTYTIGGPYWRTEVGAFASSPSAYGTFDQGGNVANWNETAFSSVSRGGAGGGFIGSGAGLSKFASGDTYPTTEEEAGGFRVGSLSVPEPRVVLLLLFGIVTGCLWWQWKK